MPNIGPLELFIIVLPLFWILPAYLVAKYAQGKGQSFGAFFVFGLLLGWVITGIVALLIRSKPHVENT
jgi:hypothetical protein